MKLFYSHLIEIESLVIEIDKLELSESEKKHLAGLVDHSLHTSILDAILSELSEEDKKVFLEHLKNNDHDSIWGHLHSKAENIEEKIQKAAKELKEELHKDLKEAHKIKKISK